MKSSVVITGLWMLAGPVLLLASEADGQMTSEQIKKQIELIERQVDEQQFELKLQHKRAKQLELRVECNWSLLRGYEHCEDAYDKTDREYVNCIAGIKEAFNQCQRDILSD